MIIHWNDQLLNHYKETWCGIRLYRLKWGIDFTHSPQNVTCPDCLSGANLFTSHLHRLNKWFNYLGHIGD